MLEFRMFQGHGKALLSWDTEGALKQASSLATAWMIEYANQIEVHHVAISTEEGGAQVIVWYEKAAD